jgi:hypothetical protein
MPWSKPFAPVGRTVPHIPDDIPVGTTNDQRAAARRAVGAFVSRDHKDEEEVTREMASEAAEFMLALGIFPGQEAVDFRIPEAYRFDWCQ